MAYYNQPNIFPNGSSTGLNGNYSSNVQNYSNAQPTVVFVSGEQGANNYPVAAGNTVYLMDFMANKFWIKSTAPNGSSQQLRSFDFVETTPKVETGVPESNFVTKKELDDLKSYLDDQFQGVRNQLFKMKRGPVNDKSDAK